jgi:hypothetical protein
LDILNKIHSEFRPRIFSLLSLRINQVFIFEAKTPTFNVFEELSSSLFDVFLALFVILLLFNFDLVPALEFMELAAFDLIEAQDVLEQPRLEAFGVVVDHPTFKSDLAFHR